MMCPNCSTLNPNNVKKCIKCGTKLDSGNKNKITKKNQPRNNKTSVFKTSVNGDKIKSSIKKIIKTIIFLSIILFGIIFLYSSYKDSIMNFIKTNKYTSDIYQNVKILSISKEELELKAKFKKDSVFRIEEKILNTRDSLNQILEIKKRHDNKMVSSKTFNYYNVMTKKHKKQFVHKDTTVYESKSDAQNAQKYKKGTKTTDRFIYGKDKKKMVLVDAQIITMGDNSGNTFEKPEHKVSINSFYMDIYEVTNGEFRNFMRNTNYKPKGKLTHLKDKNFRGNRQPIVDVAYEDAQAYASWAGKRLPTEQEWVAAAMQGSNTLYPTGKLVNKRMANFGEYIKLGKTKKVGSYPPNKFGIYDLAGNASEWVYGMFQKFPYNNVDNHYYNKVRLTKGGSWMSPQKDLKCNRRVIKNFFDSGVIGFRCVKSKK